MTPEQKAAYVNAMAAILMARISALNCQIQYELKIGMIPTVGPNQFEKLVQESGCDHNSVFALFLNEGEMAMMNILNGER